ncbi:MAG: gamma-glutamyl-gamma-aminobutyrate hydrolase family protein [Erysipelotrichaceae bacterium]|nr:gamma-glutamyl-gamma-aminobutyrate hydrolase family protein [Erysipelotrichaceae bacterium]MBQ2582530.1 gamma-glutamyl-gamma-aminobutyrate hydrolase family protein [Erysipelotrichaceae bacterium]
MKKPLIGIVSKQRNKTGKNRDLWNRMDVADELRYLVVKHGGLAIVLMPSEETMEFNQTDLGDDKVLSEEEIAGLRQQVDLCDGIILQGGDFSCQYEVEIGKYALEKDLPLIGFCAGFNNILRALGSNIYEDHTKSHCHYVMDYRHDIRIVKGTKLYDLIGQEVYPVNSLHTMVADPPRVEPYAKISAYSMDGLVESYEVPGKKFTLGFKWHPELMMGEEYVDKLFAQFVDACRK